MNGVDAMTDAVKVTLGPKGRNVLIHKSWGSPKITKDGVTVAKEIELEDRFENIGAQMVRQAASETSDAAGDGTTTATVLARAIYRQAAKLVAAGVNPMSLKRGIDKAVGPVVEELRKISRPIKDQKDIAQVGTLSANNDPAIGDLIAEAMEKVGKQGVITVEEAKSMETTLKVVEGMQFERGYLSPYFVTDPVKMTVQLENPCILLHESRINTMRDLLPILEQVAKAGKSIRIMGEDVDGDALATLVVNKLRGTLVCAAVKTPGFGDHRRATLEDLAALTGGRAISEDLGVKLETITLQDLGTAKRVIVEKDSTTIIDGGGDRKGLGGAHKTVESSNRRDKQPLRQGEDSGTPCQTGWRRGRYPCGGGHRNRNAREEGSHRGCAQCHSRRHGGRHCSRRRRGLLARHEGTESGWLSGEEQLGITLIERALEAPARQIAANAGFEGAVVLQHIMEGEGGFGFMLKREYTKIF